MNQLNKANYAIEKKFELKLLFIGASDKFIISRNYDIAIFKLSKIDDEMKFKDYAFKITVKELIEYLGIKIATYAPEWLVSTEHNIPIATGNINAVEDYELKTNFDIYKGFSGCPVVDADFNLIGFNFSKSKERNISFIFPSNLISKHITE